MMKSLPNALLRNEQLTINKKNPRNYFLGFFLLAISGQIVETRQ